MAAFLASMAQRGSLNVIKLEINHQYYIVKWAWSGKGKKQIKNKKEKRENESIKAEWPNHTSETKACLDIKRPSNVWQDRS